jgi:hypothetical protein
MCGMRMCVYAYICVSTCATRVCVVGSVHVGVFSTHLFHHYATLTHTHTHTHTQAPPGTASWGPPSALV